MNEDRLKRLAQKIERMAEHDEFLLAKAQRVVAVRRAAAMALYGICSVLVNGLNRQMTNFKVDLSPDEFTPETFRDTGVNLVQINFNGRLVQFAFESTDETVSTEYFSSPYVLQGAIRWFNQELLEERGIEEEQIFYCWNEKSGGTWRWMDPKSRRVGYLDGDHLMGVLERL